MPTTRCVPSTCQNIRSDNDHQLIRSAGTRTYRKRLDERDDWLLHNGGPRQRRDFTFTRRCLEAFAACFWRNLFLACLMMSAQSTLICDVTSFSKRNFIWTFTKRLAIVKASKVSMVILTIAAKRGMNQSCHVVHRLMNMHSEQKAISLFSSPLSALPENNARPHEEEETRAGRTMFPLFFGISPYGKRFCGGEGIFGEISRLRSVAFILAIKTFAFRLKVFLLPRRAIKAHSFIRLNWLAAAKCRRLLHRQRMKTIRLWSARRVVVSFRYLPPCRRNSSRAFVSAMFWIRIWVNKHNRDEANNTKTFIFKRKHQKVIKWWMMSGPCNPESKIARLDSRERARMVHSAWPTLVCTWNAI